MIEDTLYKAILFRGEDVFTTEGLRMITGDLASFVILWPWVEAGTIEVFPGVYAWTELGETISELAD